MKKKNVLRKRKGFTLIELIVVIAILGILAAIIIPRFSTVTENAQQRAVKSNIKIAVSAVQMYMAEHDGNLPTQGTDLNEYLQGGWAGLNDSPEGATYGFAVDTATGAITITGTLDGQVTSETVD